MAIDSQNDHKMHRRVPLKQVVVVGLGLLVAIAIGSVLYIGFSVAVENTDDLLSDKVEITLDGISARVDMYLQPVEQQALEIVRAFDRGALSLDDPAKLETYLIGLLSASPQVSAIGIAKPDKTMTSILRRDMEIVEGPWPKNKSVEPLFRQINDSTGMQWMPPVWSNRLNQIIATLHIPLHQKGRFVGMLIQTVPIKQLSRYLSKDSDNDGVAFILYDTDKLIAHPALIKWAPAKKPDQNSGPPVATVGAIGDTVLDELLNAPGHEPTIISGLKRSQGKMVQTSGLNYVLFTRPITRYGSEQWTLGLYLATDTVGDTVKRLVLALVIGLMFLVLSVGLAMYSGSRLSRPIRSLAGAMQQVREGKIDDVNILPRSQISELDDAALSFNKMVSGLRERDLIRQTLGRYVPKKVAESLLKENGVLTTEETVATVLFADIAGFTSLTENLGAEGIIKLLNAYFSDMVEIIERHGGVVTQFQGDAILATFNIPIKDPQHATKALQSAIEMRQHFETAKFAGQSLHARIGVNTGHLIAGAVGAQGRLNYTVHGDAVNLAARIENLNKEYGTSILTTQTTIDQAPGFSGKFMGETTVRGQTSPVRLYALLSETSA